MSSSTFTGPAPAYFTRSRTVFLNGAWHTGTAGTALTAVSPSTAEVFAEFVPASPAQAQAAAEAASLAFPHWRRTSGAERAEYLAAFAEGLRARKPDLVALQMLNSGKPRFEAEIDVEDAAATFDYYAGLAREMDAGQGKPLALADPALGGRSFLEPLGPVALIVPWNFPMVTTAWKLAPALAAGCTAVLKPSEFTTLAELVYGDIALACGLPAGVLNIVPGGGAIGGALCTNPVFRKISFTGSNATGARVMAAAAERTVPVSLELGGKSPLVVLEGSDPATAADIIAAGIFFNAGQMCSATSRVILPAASSASIEEALLAKVRSLQLGGPGLAEADMGPLTTRPQFGKVQGYLRQAAAGGLTCLHGGKAADIDGGFFIEPTVFRDVPASHPVWREEIFGPVVALTTAPSPDEAMALANDTDYGLAATVVGPDADEAQAFAARIDAGHVWINTPQIIFPNTAWGGFKGSGIGRELGPWGLSAYCAVKFITRPS
ncbi:aldehyde dehydrogenase family protein [Pannonibacter phragmitetus]|uniref:aldehyde dehydrogenase family protein n=1 Tax=Pannonibacter phragmitetus TaxID=121719 RepID=UPI000F042644|nr:aldehyde dehydrogenase family protein [Pannonibacter phragmitetus]